MRQVTLLVFLGLASLGILGQAQDKHNHDASKDILTLPTFSPLDLAGSKLKVVATTSIIGDIVTRVGGDVIALSTLMGSAQDPHSYQAAAKDLTEVAKADVVFVNGWDLEERLVKDLATIASAPLVAVSAHIIPLEFGADAHDHDDNDGHGDEDHHHSGADPHVWFSIANVKQWLSNIEQVLSQLDPAHAPVYAANAATYQRELDVLAAYAESQLAAIPEDRRYLVSNHDALAYFAHDYGFEVIGTIIPSISSLAEPSASNLAELIKEMQFHNVCALFTETTLNDKLAQTVASELKHCTEVKVLRLYTGALGPVGSEADSYIGMYKANVDAIVQGLR